MKKTETYDCGVCGGTFEKGWSDDEAKAEYALNFPQEKAADLNRGPFVCDDCYQQFMAWFNTRGDAQREEMLQDAKEVGR